LLGDQEINLPNQKSRQSVYDLPGHTPAQRITLAALLGIEAAISWWLLTGGGVAMVGSWLGRSWAAGDWIRRICLASGFAIYFVRILFTVFVFLKRGMSWGEVWIIAIWMAGIILLLGIVAGANQAALGAAGGLGIFLYGLGSWMNSYAEYARHLWKQRPENRGRLYTRGLFRFCRHPNYLGDLLLFSGLSLISGSWITSIVPALMLGGFVFFNIPAQDAHLHQHYGEAFASYARRTAKLIPFIY
jgi:protein-S-isoprenylcysteine O-methyltransferase Ste14